MTWHPSARGRPALWYIHTVGPRLAETAALATSLCPASARAFRWPATRRVAAGRDPQPQGQTSPLSPPSASTRRAMMILHAPTTCHPEVVLREYGARGSRPGCRMNTLERALPAPPPLPPPPPPLPRLLSISSYHLHTHPSPTYEGGSTLVIRTALCTAARDSPAPPRAWPRAEQTIRVLPA